MRWSAIPKTVALLILACGPHAGAYDYHLPAPITLDEGVNQFGLLKETGENMCAPTATTNSFTYLTNAFPRVYNPTGTPKLMGGKGSWSDAAQLLASPQYMNTSETSGTTPEDWANGKYSYVQKYAPDTTAFSGMDSDDMEKRPLWVQNASPTIDFLIQELKNHEDVELWLRNPGEAGLDHVVTLTGLVWDGTTLTLNTIDPANPTNLGKPWNTKLMMTPPPDGTGTMTITSTNYDSALGGIDLKGYSLTGALGESVPEPRGLLLLGIGMIIAIGSSIANAYASRRSHDRVATRS